MMDNIEKIIFEEETAKLAKYDVFRTTDFVLAKFLMDMGMDFSMIRGEYVFLRTPELDKYVRIGNAFKK